MIRSVYNREIDGMTKVKGGSNMTSFYIKKLHLGLEISLVGLKKLLVT